MGGPLNRNFYAVAPSAVVEALAAFPECAATENEISHAVGGAKITSPIQILRKKSVLNPLWTLTPPRAGARKVRAVRLVPNWDEAEAEAVRREDKAPAQARLLRALASAGGGPVPVAEILRGAEASPAAAKKLEDVGLIQTDTIEVRRRPFRFAAGAAVPPMMTSEQEAAVQGIKTRLDTRQANTALLYGVTASGKTEVYLRAIAETRRRNRTALVLVPEIALTAQVVDTFRARIGDKVAVLHSALSAGEKRDEWQRIGQRRGRCRGWGAVGFVCAIAKCGPAYFGRGTRKFVQAGQPGPALSCPRGGDCAGTSNGRNRAFGVGNSRRGVFL